MVVNNSSDDQLLNLVAILTQYYVKTIEHLDSQKLSDEEYDNIAVCLQLVETLLLESSDECHVQEKILNVIVSTAGVARASSLLVEHILDDGTDDDRMIPVVYMYIGTTT